MVKKSDLKKFALLLGLIGWGGFTTSVKADSQQTTSSVTIKIVGNQEAVKPLNPLLPEDQEPGIPSGSATGSTAELSIDFISDIQLGTQKITSENRVYDAKPQEFQVGDQKIARPNFIQVSDLRGSFAGWTLKVAQLNQFQAEKNQQPLKGARLTFKNGSLVSTTNARYRPDFFSSFTLIPQGVEQVVAWAGENEGMGTWLYRLGDLTNMEKSIGLAVPGSAQKFADQYQTNLLWKLENTPINQ